MINGAHFLLYSKDPDADRAFLRDTLELQSVDAGRGWLIFALPPSEVAVHPSEGDSAKSDSVVGAELYLMCDDLGPTMRHLKGKGVNFRPTSDQPWGILTSFALPSGLRVGLYQPKHPTAHKLR